MIQVIFMHNFLTLTLGKIIISKDKLKDKCLNIFNCMFSDCTTSGVLIDITQRHATLWNV